MDNNQNSDSNIGMALVVGQQNILPGAIKPKHLQANTQNAQGDIYYVDKNGSFARLGAGTNGQYLQTQGANANPQWATVSSSTPDPLVADALNARTTNHVTITPGTSKLVKIASNFDNNSSNTYHNNTVFLSGWRRIQWDGTHSYVQTAISWPFTLTTVDSLIVTSGPNSTSSSITPSTSAFDRALVCGYYGLSTSGVTVDVRTLDTSIPANTEYGVFNYILIGTL